MVNERIRRENIGCTGKKNVFAEGTKQKQCVHIRICALKEDLVYQIKDIEPAYVEEDKDEDDKNDLGEDAIKDKDAKKSGRIDFLQMADTSQDLNKSLSNEEFIDQYFKEVTDYNAVYNKLYEDILHKVMYHINSNVLSDTNITDRSEPRKSKKSVESEELISNLKTEVEFLRNEIREKNELIKTLSLRENCQRNIFIPETNLSVTSAVDATHSNSKNVINDSGNGFNDVDSQLITIRKQKHLLYNDLKKKQKAKDKKRKSVVCDGTKKSVFIIGDSMLNGVYESQIKDENFDVQLKYFSGAKVADVSDKLGDFIEQKPDCIILHVGTNNSPNMSSNEIIDEILTVRHRIEKEAPETKVVISAPIVRTDNGKAALTIRNIIKHLQQLDIEIINNENINHKDLGRKGLHLSKYGKSKFAKNLKSKLNKLF